MIQSNVRTTSARTGWRLRYLILAAWLPLGCNASDAPEGASSGGTGGDDAGGIAENGGAGAGGVGGEDCTYEGTGATDPQPVGIECDTLDSSTFAFEEPQLCTGATHAAFIAGKCGGGAFCLDHGDWATIEANVDAAFGEVVSAVPIGCDRQGVEIIIALAAEAFVGTLSVSGTVDGFEPCHGQDVTCGVGATTYELDVTASDCADTGDWYCGDEPNSQLETVIGTGGAGGAAP